MAWKGPQAWAVVWHGVQSLANFRKDISGRFGVSFVGYRPDHTHAENFRMREKSLPAKSSTTTRVKRFDGLAVEQVMGPTQRVLNLCVAR